MNVLLAIPLLLAAQASPSVGEAPEGMIAFEVRLVDCEAIGWRGSYQTRLRFGGHRAGCSAWVADRETFDALADELASAAGARVVKAPSVVATPGDPAVIGTSTTRHFVVHAEPEEAADGAEAAAGHRPVVAPVDDGSQIRLVGVPHPDGMIVLVEVMDTRVAAVHVVEADAVRVQVPEVSHREMGGEWLLPGDHGLVLSLGVESVGRDDGKSVVKERLLLISAEMISSRPAVPVVDPGVRQAGTAPTPAAVHVIAPEGAEHAVVNQGPMRAEPAPITPPTPNVPGVVSGMVLQPGPVPMGLAATPWGLLPILPVEFVAVGAVPEVPGAGPMPVPNLPSRTLPPAVDVNGRAVDPRTEKDREAERTEFTPYVDGQPVPTPQVTVPPACEPAGGAAGGTTVRDDPDGERPKRDGSAITVRFSIGLPRGLAVDVDFGKAAGAEEATADAGPPPIRR